MSSPLILMRRAAATLAAIVLTLLTIASPASAQTEPPNADFDDIERLDLLVVDAAGNALESGGGLTTLGVELEGEDQCPGDSAHDQYRIDSYMVPVATDPRDLDFNGAGPYPSQFRTYAGYQMPLQEITGNGYSAELTGQATEAGGPGPIGDIPAFDFHVYVPTPGIDDWEGGVPAGSYRIGVACTFAGRITNLWETTIEVTDDRTDEPVGMRWTVTGPQPGDLETAPSEANTLVYSLLAFAAVLAAGAYLLHRSSKRADRPTPDARPKASVS